MKKQLLSIVLLCGFGHLDASEENLQKPTVLSEKKSQKPTVLSDAAPVTSAATKHPTIEEEPGLVPREDAVQLASAESLDKRLLNLGDNYYAGFLNDTQLTKILGGKAHRVEYIAMKVEGALKTYEGIGYCSPRHPWAQSVIADIKRRKTQILKCFLQEHPDALSYVSNK